MRVSHALALLLLVLVLTTPAHGASPLDNLDWSVQYMIDQSQTVLGVNQFNQPRDNRGLAISPDGRYLYAGYNNPEGSYEVRRIDVLQADYNDATVAHLVGVSRGKAIAVDDTGRVYLADGSSIKIYDASLTTLQHTISVTKGEGVAVAREGSQLVLFSSDRTTGNLSKRLLSESGGSVIGDALDTSFGVGGEAALSPDLRGVEVDSLGRIWVADMDGNAVYVVAANGSSYSTIAVHSPMDVAFAAGTALVSRYTDVLLSRFTLDTLLSAGSDLAPPLSALELTATPATGGHGGLSGMAVVGGKLFVAGEGINTASEHSTYGRTDEQSGWIGDKFYTDLTHDDNDSIFRASWVVPEPAGILTLLSGMVGLGGLLSRRKRS